MAYNRYNVGGGGYPPVVPNPGGMYNQPMPPSHQPPPQYGQPYNRNAGVWNMPPGPPQQQMSPWINNNIPTSFRGYAYDNRHPNMNPNMGLKPNLRMSQGNKRPMDWNNSPNNKRNRIGGNLNNNNNNNQLNQKNKPNPNLNPPNASNPQQKKPWVNFNKNNSNNNNRNNNANNNFNKRRSQNNRDVKANDKTKKETPIENIKTDSGSEQASLDSAQEKYFTEASGLICNLCDVFLRDKACAAEHSKLETHQTKFNEAVKEEEEKAKAAAEAEAAAAAAAAASTSTDASATESSQVKEETQVDNKGDVSKEESVETSNTEAAEQNDSGATAEAPLPVTTEGVEASTEAPTEVTPVANADATVSTEAPSDAAESSATISEGAGEPAAEEPAESAVETGDAEFAQRGGGRGGRGNRGRGGRGRSRGRGRR